MKPWHGSKFTSTCSLDFGVANVLLHDFINAWKEKINPIDLRNLSAWACVRVQSIRMTIMAFTGTMAAVKDRYERLLLPEDTDNQ